jgi:enoyl-CoA hydratase
MTWGLEARNGAVVMTMRSSPVNKMNPAFFDDLHAALDRLERDHPRVPLVLTSEGQTFSAGLDFEDVFPRFARGDHEEIAAWFARFRDSLLRVLELPRRTVAAINGNAFAGGLILALCCDRRLAAVGPARFALNEVVIGIPMPGVYVEIVRHALGTRAAAELMLDCPVLSIDDAVRLGVLHRTVAAGDLLGAAVADAANPGESVHAVYAATKAALLAPTLDRIRGPARLFDEAAIRAVTTPESQRAQAAALARLKERRPS